MGYRSFGKSMALDEEAQKLLPKELKDDLAKDWTYESGGVWSFEGWKWYSSYPIIDMWDNFLALLEDKNMDEHYDYARVGEEYEDVTIATYNKFGLNRDIEVY